MLETEFYINKIKTEKIYIKINGTKLNTSLIVKIIFLSSK